MTDPYPRRCHSLVPNPDGQEAYSRCHLADGHEGDHRAWNPRTGGMLTMPQVTDRDEVMDLYEFLDYVRRADAHLDANVSQDYKDQPLAQHWARVAKVTEEAGEALDALIGITGQNPRKGVYSSHTQLYLELCDTALTAIYGLQHFTKDSSVTWELLFGRASYHLDRLENSNTGDTVDMGKTCPVCGDSLKPNQTHLHPDG